MVFNYLRKNVVRFLLGLVIGLTLYFVYVTIQQGWNAMACHADGLFIAGAVVFGVGLLSIVLNLGAFNIFSYQAGRRRLESGRKEDLYEYTQRKKLEREAHKFGFVAYFITSVPFFLACAILYLILNA